MQAALEIRGPETAFFEGPILKFKPYIGLFLFSVQHLKNMSTVNNEICAAYSYQNDGSLGQVVRVVPVLALFLAGIRHCSVEGNLIGHKLQKNDDEETFFFNVY